MKAICKTKTEPGIELLEVDVPDVRVPVILGHEFAGEVISVLTG